MLCNYAFTKIISSLFVSSLRAKATLNQVSNVSTFDIIENVKLKVSVSTKPSIEFFDNIEYRTSTSVNILTFDGEIITSLDV